MGLWGVVKEGGLGLGVCCRQHYCCHGVVAHCHDMWGCGWVKWVGHGIDGIIVAQVGLWGVLGAGGLGLDRAVT
jgi:hypothetical protein